MDWEKYLRAIFSPGTAGQPNKLGGSLAGRLVNAYLGPTGPQAAGIPNSLFNQSAYADPGAMSGMPPLQPPMQRGPAMIAPSPMPASPVPASGGSGGGGGGGGGMMGGGGGSGILSLIMSLL